jgi:hypothetical protein
MNVNNPFPQTYQAGIVRQAFDAGNYVTEGTGVDFADDVSLAMGKVENDGFDVNRDLRPAQGQGPPPRPPATTREPIYQDVARPGLAGHPVRRADHLGRERPVGQQLRADHRRPNMAILGVRQDFTFKIFTEGVISDGSGNVVTNLMQQDAVAMRAVGRFAFAVANPINRDNATDATRFPFAVVVNAGS